MNLSSRTSSCVIPKLLPLEPNRGRGLRPLPQFEVPPDPTPEYFVRELAYATSYGADNTGGERNLSPGTPSSLFRNPGGGEVSPPPDPHFSVPKDKKNKFKTMGSTSPSIVPTVKIRIPQGILQNEFRRGFGGNLFSKVPPEAEPMGTKPKVGLEGGLRINNFHPPDCGGANPVYHYVGNNAPPLASERSERARWGESEVPEE